MATLTASAGSDQTTGTASVLTLVGGVTGGGDIYRVRWTQISGPDCLLATPSMFVTNVYALHAGTYVFNLFIEDVNVATSNDQITVVVSNTGNNIPTIPTEEYATDISR